MKSLFPVLLTLPLLLAACGDSGTLRVDGLVARSAAMTAASASAQTLELGGGDLVVERARIALSEIEFEGGSGDEREAELGAAVIDLALDGSPTEVAASAVAAGSYHTIGLELQAGNASGSEFDDFGGDDPASILVDGTYGGAAFTYRSSVVPELEFPIEPEVDVQADSEAAVGVTFDVAAWFLAADGAVLDPTDVASRATIEANILESFAAHAELEFEDDGEEDSDED